MIFLFPVSWSPIESNNRTRASFIVMVNFFCFSFAKRRDDCLGVTCACHNSERMDACCCCCCVLCTIASFGGGARYQKITGGEKVVPSWQSRAISCFSSTKVHSLTLITGLLRLLATTSGTGNQSCRFQKPRKIVLYMMVYGVVGGGTLKSVGLDAELFIMLMGRLILP